METVERTQGGGAQIPEFVFQVLCARARRRFDPLDRSTLRGLLIRCGLRVQDLLALGTQPVGLVNKDEGNPSEHQLISALFTDAVVDRVSAIEDERAQQAFVSRMGQVITQLHTHTPYRFPTDEPEENKEAIDRILVKAGLRIDPSEALISLAAALPPRPLAPPLPRIDPAAPLRPVFSPARTRPVLFKLPPQRLDQSMWISAIAILDGALSPLEMPPAPADARLDEPSAPVIEAAPLHTSTQIAVLPPTAILGRANLDDAGRDMDRWLSLPGIIIGIGGASLGTWLIVEGLVNKSLALVLFGLSVVLFGLAFDFVIELFKGIRRRRRALQPPAPGLPLSGTSQGIRAVHEIGGE